MPCLTKANLVAAGVDPELVRLFTERTSGVWEIRPEKETNDILRAYVAMRRNLVREMHRFTEDRNTRTQHVRDTAEAEIRRLRYEITNARAKLDALEQKNEKEIKRLLHPIRGIISESVKEQAKHAAVHFAAMKALFESDDGRRTLQQINPNYGMEMQDHARMITLKRQTRTREEFLAEGNLTHKNWKKPL